MRRNARGSATVELFAVMPWIALIVLIIAQCAALFHEALAQTDAADAAALERLAVWELTTRGTGFDRPCLELMPERTVRAAGRAMPIGAGAGRRQIAPTEEVALVLDDICIPAARD